MTETVFPTLQLPRLCRVCGAGADIAYEDPDFWAEYELCRECDQAGWWSHLSWAAVPEWLPVALITFGLVLLVIAAWVVVVLHR